MGLRDGDPKLPASLLSDGGSIESAQVTADSERLMQLEAIRTQALMNHHRYEAHESLRTALLRKSQTLPRSLYSRPEGGILPQELPDG